MDPKTCHHCRNEWTPRKENPKKCPRCMNPLWKSPRPKKIAASGNNAKRGPELVTQDEVLPIDGGNGIDSPEYTPIESDVLAAAKAKAEELLRRLV